MRVLLACEAVFPENKGGIERWFQTLGKEFCESKNSVTYFNSTAVNEVRDGIKYVSVIDDTWSYRKGGVRSKAEAIKFGIKLFLWLRKQEFDLIYCSSVPIFSIFAVSMAKSQKTIVFTEWFEVWSMQYWIRYSGIIAGPIGWLVQSLALQFGDKRFVYTLMAKDAVSRANLLNRNDVHVLPGLCPQSDVDLEIQESRKRNDVYFLGRFVDEKQPILAIAAIEEFIKTGWHGKFWLLGTGPIAPELEMEIQRRGLEDSVELVVNPTDLQVEEIAANSFALLHPSRREGYGLASVEAAYRGIPSILINYPDNATLELEIAPKLVAQKGEVREIASLLTLAWIEQENFRVETLAWAHQASLSRNLRSTSSEIMRIAEEMR
jgi:glycosyltransferase involved in cell wall biosynthesis